jgi:hypothetical protein
MSRVIRILLALSVAVLALPSESAWAQRRGGFHHRHHTVVVGAFFFGAPIWYSYHYPPYYYGPYYEASSAPPSIYVEKFEGAPAANSGEIYCPSLGGYYPDVQECPVGWQRVIRPAEAAAQGG